LQITVAASSQKGIKPKLQ